MTTIVEVNPFRCRMWALHDRLEDYLSEESCKAELESVSKHGQLVPALGRRVHNNPDYDVELVAGSRRLFVAKLLNLPLKVELREMTDREAAIAMDIENRHRQDISPYERGLSYSRMLRCGQFKSQDELAQALEISPPQVSRLLKLARLPTVILAAFERPLDICENWGVDLMDLWEDPNMKPHLAQRARAIAALSVRPAPQEIFRSLISLAPLSRRRSAHRDEVVTNSDGTPLFRIRQQQKWVAVLLPREQCSSSSLQAVRDTLAELLESEQRRLQAIVERRASPHAYCSASLPAGAIVVS